MPNYLPLLTKSKKITIQTILDDINSRKDKDLFRPSGTQVYITL